MNVKEFSACLYTLEILFRRVCGQFIYGLLSSKKYKLLNVCVNLNRINSKKLSVLRENHIITFLYLTITTYIKFPSGVDMHQCVCYSD
jgi:hypothetical protein